MVCLPIAAQRVVTYLLRGDIVRVGPNHVVTRNPDDWRRIFAVRSEYRRSEWFDCVQLQPGVANVLSERDDRLHNILRSKMSIGVGGILSEVLMCANIHASTLARRTTTSKNLSTSTSLPLLLSSRASIFPPKKHIDRWIFLPKPNSSLLMLSQPSLSESQLVPSPMMQIPSVTVTIPFHCPSFSRSFVYALT